MEFKITDLQLGKIGWNYDEIKSELAVRLNEIKSVVYTDEQISDAKADRSTLNKLKKAINDERIKQEKEFNKPFETFKNQTKEIIKMIDEASEGIDKQIKEHEEAVKAEKLEHIKTFFVLQNFDAGITFEQIFDSKWLNASVSMKSIEDAIKAKNEKIINDMAVIDNLQIFSFEAMEVYKQTLDLSSAVSEAHRLSEQLQRKQAYEAQKNAVSDVQTASSDAKAIYAESIEESEAKEDERTWISFKVYVSAEEAKKLGSWLKENHIKYGKA